jgi:hypothetical protein
MVRVVPTARPTQARLPFSLREKPPAVLSEHVRQQVLHQIARLMAQIVLRPRTSEVVDEPRR